MFAHTQTFVNTAWNRYEMCNRRHLTNLRFIRRLTLNPWVFNPFDRESRERFISSINPFQLWVRV